MPEKKFYQGLIQAAVGLCHFCNGNMRGAAKLYKSSREYMMRFGTPYMGLDQTAFLGSDGSLLRGRAQADGAGPARRDRRGIDPDDRAFSGAGRVAPIRPHIWKRKSKFAREGSLS